MDIIINQIMKVISIMTMIPEDSKELIAIRERLDKIVTKEETLEEVFDGSAIILNLPRIVPQLHEIDEYRKVDREVLIAL